MGRMAMMVLGNLEIGMKIVLGLSGDDLELGLGTCRNVVRIGVGTSRVGVG